MTSKERILFSLYHKEPDKVPIDFGGVHTSLHAYAHKNLKKFLDLDGPDAEIQEICQQIVFPDRRILNMFEVDAVGVYPKPPSFWKLDIDPDKDEWRDEWGNIWVRPKNGFFYDIKKPAMKDFTIEDLKKYDFPDPSDRGRVKGLKDEILNISVNSDKAIILFNSTVGFWENLWFLRGFEQAYIDLALNRDFVEALFDKLLWWNKSFWDLVLSEVGDYIDVVQIGDDLGTQQGPMFNPNLYKSLLKPYHKELITFIKSKTNAKIYFHCCGSIDWVISDLIDCGVDILNPVQVNAENMDSKKLKDTFGGKVSFWGGGCDPRILLQGDVAQVKDEVKRRIMDFAPDGGFIFASIHNIQANTPPENIVAIFETAIEYRNY